MAKTKIGDIFSVKIDDQSKKYFQLIAFDQTQLNSDVIRAFEKSYPLNANPNLTEILNDAVIFYAYCVTDLGLKMKYWELVTNAKEIGETTQIIFRDTLDYGIKPGEEPISISHNWRIWRINDKHFTPVGELEGENRKSYIELVINPKGIIELLKGRKYPPKYPDFK